MAEALKSNLKLIGRCFRPDFLEAADIVAAFTTPSSMRTRAAPHVTQVEVAASRPQSVSHRFQ